jgi:prophage antirepressor-like protein
MTLTKLSTPDLVFQEKTFTIYEDSLGVMWFQGFEACNQLNLTNPAQSIVRHVSREYREKIADGRGMPAWFVKEPGLYQLIFAANTEESEKFRRWVFERVLPAIRKTGQYIAAATDQQYFSPFGMTLRVKIEECDRYLESAAPDANIAKVLNSRKALKAAFDAEYNAVDRVTVIDERSKLAEKIISKVNSSPDGLRLRNIYQNVRGLSALAKREQLTLPEVTRQYCEDLASKGFISFDGKKARRLEG